MNVLQKIVKASRSFQHLTTLETDPQPSFLTRQCFDVLACL